MIRIIRHIHIILATGITGLPHHYTRENGKQILHKKEKDLLLNTLSQPNKSTIPFLRLPNSPQPFYSSVRDSKNLTSHNTEYQYAHYNPTSFHNSFSLNSYIQRNHILFGIRITKSPKILRVQARITGYGKHIPNIKIHP